MIIKLNKGSEHVTMVTLTQEELKEKCGEMLLLELGVNEIMYNNELRDELIDSYGDGRTLTVIIPDKVREEEYTLTLLNRDVQLTEVREGYSNDYKYSTVMGKKRGKQDEGY